MSYQKIEVERRPPHLGAVIEAVDLSSPLEVATVMEMGAASGNRGVL